MTNNKSPEESVDLSEQKQYQVNCIAIPSQDDQRSSEHQSSEHQVDDQRSSEHQEYNERLDKKEALELTDYKDTRKLSMLNNSSLSPEAQDPTMKDLPELLKAHKLDERSLSQVVGQLPEANRKEKEYEKQQSEMMEAKSKLDEVLSKLDEANQLLNEAKAKQTELANQLQDQTQKVYIGIVSILML